MKIRCWEFWKWKKELARRDEGWNDHCGCLSQNIIELQEELTTLKNAYFEKVKENRHLESLLNPKRDLPVKRCKKG